MAGQDFNPPHGTQREDSLIAWYATADEQELLDMFRALDEEGKQATLAAAKDLAASSTAVS